MYPVVYPVSGGAAKHVDAQSIFWGIPDSSIEKLTKKKKKLYINFTIFELYFSGRDICYATEALICSVQVN